MAATTTHQVTITDTASNTVVHNQLITAPASWNTNRVSYYVESEYRVANQAMKAALTASAVRVS